MATYTDNYNLTKPTFAESADIRTINGNMDTIDAVMHASQVSLADAYDETRTSSNPYNTGDIVMYELLMYKCLEDGVYGTWDGTKWERTTAGANGGGSDVEVTPSYNSGTKIAEIDVDGDTEEIYVPEMTGASSSSDGTAGLPPAPEAGDEDKFLKGDGKWAEVGGGADYVELTQAEYDALTPEEQMNGTIYFITDGSGGGGGGGSVKIVDTLWSGSATPSTTGTDITLSHAISDYDFIVFTINQNSGYDSIVIIAVNELTIGESYIKTGYSGSQMDVFFDYTSDTTINIKSSASAYLTTYTKITGLKFGGGGGSDSHDYDNTEKVVGTYFGKTLYEKSYQNIAGTGTSVNVTLSDLSNIETIFIVSEASASTDEIPFPYIHYNASNIIGGFFTISNGVPTLNIRRGSDMASVGLKYLTVRYTKSST